MLKKGDQGVTLKPVVETTEEELYRYISCLVLKTSTRRCLVGVFKRKLAFCKTTTKALLKPHTELVALVTLRVPPVLTFTLLNLYLT